MYVDAGSHGSGVIAWARLLTYSPQAVLHLLDGDDLRREALNGLDLVLLPGGDGFRQHKSMGPEGADAVRRFVGGGGKYLGTCAGLAISLNEPDRIQLIKYRRIMGAVRGQGRLAVKLSEKGASMLGVRSGRYMVRYSNGPLPQLTEQPATGDSEVIAVYDSTLGAPGSEGPSMYGLPAIIHGHYGEGPVLVTGFHPECYASTHVLALGCLHCLTGQVFTSEFPTNAFRPIRIAYYTAVLGNKEAIENALAIDASPATDLLTISNNDIDEGILDHSDVLVLSDGDMDLYVERLKPPHLAVINRFVDRGGFVIASEQTKSLVPGTSDRVFLLADEQTIPAMAHQISSSLSS
jgi:glutamine amidotransferase-like uncharacterized protein